MAASSSSDRYGDDYFLSAIWITGAGSGKELFPSGAEGELKGKRAAMELAVVRPAQKKLLLRRGGFRQECRSDRSYPGGDGPPG